MSKGNCIQIIRDKKSDDDTLKDTILSMPLLSVSLNNFRSSSPTGILFTIILINQLLILIGVNEVLSDCSNICNDQHVLTSLYKVLDIRETVLHKEFFSTHKINNETITQMNNPQSLNEILLLGDNFFEHILIMEKDRLSGGVVSS